MVIVAAGIHRLHPNKRLAKKHVSSPDLHESSYETIGQTQDEPISKRSQHERPSIAKHAVGASAATDPHSSPSLRVKELLTSSQLRIMPVRVPIMAPATFACTHKRLLELVHLSRC